MSLITDSYKNLNAQLHESNKYYGASSTRWAKRVMELCDKIQSQNVLDYGCGKSMLAMNLPFRIQQYDPAIPVHSEMPGPADLVVCTDVMEHIEPDCLVQVLEHIRDLTRKVVFLTISLVPAKKHLADGRNAHLIVEPARWWLTVLSQFFEVFEATSENGLLIYVGTPVENKHYQDIIEEEREKEEASKKRAESAGNVSLSTVNIVKD